MDRSFEEGGRRPGAGFDLADPFGSFLGTVRRLVLEPSAFFREMAKGGGFVAPLVFTLVCALIGGTLGGVLSFFFGLLVGDLATAFGGLFGGIFLTPILAVIGLFITAGILHLLVVILVRPRNAGFEATYRVVAYLSFLYLVSWLAAIPILGFLVSLALAVYFVVLAVIGVRETHSTTGGRAAAVVLIPAAVLLFLFLAVAVLVGIAVFFSTQQGI